MNRIHTRAITLLIAACLTACSDNDAPETTPVVLNPVDEFTSIDEQTGTIYIKDLPASVGNTYASGHIPVYFNLEKHSIINPYNNDGIIQELPEAQIQRATWDVAFTSIYNSYITFNNGTTTGTPGFGGPGRGAMIVIDKPFDELDEAPADADFEAFMQNQTSSGWQDFPVGSKGWYFYRLQSHIMSAISGITLVFRTADGKYAKFEMKTVYLGNPESPTVNTPAPYLTFRYYLQNDGSRNLSTRNRQ